MIYNKILQDGFDAKDFVSAMDHFKPSYAFSHCFHGECLPLADTMVVMRGIDELASLFTISLGTDSPNCGIQVRSVEYHS